MKYRLLLSTMLLISCGLPPGQRATTILQQGLEHESIIVRVSAAKGLGQIGDIQGTKALYEILDGEDKDGIAAALTALYDLKEKKYSPGIVKLTENKDDLIRTRAFRLVSTMDNEKYYDIFIKGTNDKIAKIRRFSYLKLEKFKDRDIILNGLRDIDPLTRIAAAQVLDSFGEEGMEDFIRKELETETINIREHGIIALAEMGDTLVIPFVKESLNDTTWELRLAAVEALFILKNQDGIAVLKEGLNSSDPFVRGRCVQILSRFELPEGSGLLVKAVHDEYVNVSVAAIEALGKLEMKENLKIFQEMMGAPNPLVKIAAATAYLRSEQWD